jgi:hypothetical protein
MNEIIAEFMARAVRGPTPDRHHTGTAGTADACIELLTIEVYNLRFELHRLQGELQEWRTASRPEPRGLCACIGCPRKRNCACACPVCNIERIKKEAALVN